MSFPDWARRRISRWPNVGEQLTITYPAQGETLLVSRSEMNPRYVVFMLFDERQMHATHAKPLIYRHELYPEFDPLAAYPVAEEARRADQVTR